MVLALCATLIASPAARAEEKPAAAFTIVELMHSLSQVKSSRATFVEQKYMSLMYAPLEYSGTLAYTAPGRVEKHTLKPRPESMVLDKETLIVQNGTAGKRRVLALQEYPVAWAFVESFRSTLAGDVQTLNRFYQVKLEGQPEKWLLILKPIEPRMKTLVSEIRIGGSGDHIASIEVWEAEGDHSVMTIRQDDP